MIIHSPHAECSSEPSSQSRVPSHSLLAATHSPPPQRNWSAVSPRQQRASSLPSKHSWRPSQRAAHPPSAQLTWSAVHTRGAGVPGPGHAASSSPPTQSRTPSHTAAAATQLPSPHRRSSPVHGRGQSSSSSAPGQSGLPSHTEAAATHTRPGPGHARSGGAQQPRSSSPPAHWSRPSQRAVRGKHAPSSHCHCVTSSHGHAASSLPSCSTV